MSARAFAQARSRDHAMGTRFGVYANIRNVQLTSCFLRWPRSRWFLLQREVRPRRESQNTERIFAVSDITEIIYAMRNIPSQNWGSQVCALENRPRQTNECPFRMKVGKLTNLRFHLGLVCFRNEGVQLLCRNGRRGFRSRLCDETIHDLKLWALTSKPGRQGRSTLSMKLGASTKARIFKTWNLHNLSELARTAAAAFLS